ncbi:hypothetical protein SUGI_0904230 [Cryptomeria japonica]|nr:hypothetical protein SUGI_0904230 [Cryptomeria japonica]
MFFNLVLNLCDVLAVKSLPAHLSIAVSVVVGILLLSLIRWKHQSSHKQHYFDERVKKYCDVFKTSLIGYPTLVVYGPAGNCLVLSNEEKLVKASWPKSFMKLMGEESILNQREEKHLILRAALARFLGPRALQSYISKMSSEIQLPITEKWKGKSQVKMLPLVRELIFSVASSLIFDMKDDSERTRLRQLMETALAVSLAIPLDFQELVFAKRLRHTLPSIKFSLI